MTRARRSDLWCGGGGVHHILGITFIYSVAYDFKFLDIPSIIPSFFISHCSLVRS